MKPFIAALLVFLNQALWAEQSPTNNRFATAYFAGGCFWCMEPPFDKQPGVLRTISGYMGGALENPTYKQVSAGGTGHAETLEVTYDPSQVNYEQLLEIFWRNIDPTDSGGQFCDRGYQYRSAIFVLDDNQRKQAEKSLQDLQVGRFAGAAMATTITSGGAFYPAEDYHQNYYQRNPLRYKYYRYRCGRDARLQELWGDSP